MFSVIISEKGGAERREAFERTEINVGRVQGNDLMLPKGNVSKRHARLLFRDGRFIVTDLKSTNGTYVNGRKIAQATIVREGDKIYIGDFVLRIEGAGSASPHPQAPGPGDSQMADPLSPVESPSSSEPSSAEKSIARSLSPRIEAKSNDHAREIVSHFPLEQDPDESVPYAAVPGPPRVPSTPRPSGKPSAPPPLAPSPAPAIASPSAPPADPPLAGEKTVGASTRFVDRSPLLPSAVQAFTAAREGAEGAPGAAQSIPRPISPLSPLTPARPVPPSLGAPATLSAAVLPPPPLSPTVAGAADLTSLPLVGPGGSQSGDRITAPSAGVAGSLSAGSFRTAESSNPPAATALGSSTPPRRLLPAMAERAAPESPQVAAHRAALTTLVERTGQALDLSLLATGAAGDEAFAARVQRTLTERATALRAQGELPGDVDLDTLVAEARRELLELGPLTALLDDEDVTELQVVRHDHVVALHGRQRVVAEVAFTCEEAVARAVRRLCLSAGRALGETERFVERRLPRGGRLFAVLPQAAGHGHMLVIRKPERADLTLEDLVRSGTISRAMAGLLAQCVAGRANILVTGSVGAGTTSLLGALAAAGTTEDRVVVLQEDDELVFNQPHTISILLGDAPGESIRAVQAAARARPDRLVAGTFSGPLAAAIVDAMGDGIEGLLAAARAPTLRQAVARLTADLAAAKPGLSPDMAREWLASSFDLAIEIARLKDGRHRVLRIAELTPEDGRMGVKDVFSFSVERTAAGGTVEGTFHATGLVPAIVDDLAARGLPIDPAIFKRHAETSSRSLPSRP